MWLYFLVLSWGDGSVGTVFAVVESGFFDRIVTLKRMLLVPAANS